MPTKFAALIMVAIAASGCATTNWSKVLGAPLTWKTAALSLAILVFILAVTLSTYVLPDRPSSSTGRWSLIWARLSVWLKVIGVVLFFAWIIGDHFMPPVSDGEDPGPYDGPHARGDY